MVVELINGKYLLGGIIGMGGMGRIHVAEEVATGRTVAIKVMHPALAKDPTLVARLAEEAEATRRVSHPNVIRVLDYGTAADGAPFLVMERIRGRPLGAVIRSEAPLEPSRILRIASQLLAGLSAIHRAGLAHGDVKSDNVLVEAQADDRVTIIDLGVARALADVVRAGTDRLLAGTPDYMAPEVVGGDAPSVQSDLYGVGVILYELVTATTPFGGGTTAEVLARQVSETLVPPSIRCPECAIPRAFEDEICRALEKSPDARPSSAASYALALHHAWPPMYEHHTRRPHSTTTFSTNADTAEWVRPTLKPTARWHHATACGAPEAGGRS